MFKALSKLFKTFFSLFPLKFFYWWLVWPLIGPTSPKDSFVVHFFRCNWKAHYYNQFRKALIHYALVQHIGRVQKTRKWDGAEIKKKAKRQKLQQTLVDSSAGLLSTTSLLLTAPTDGDLFGDLLRDEPMGFNPYNDSIDDLLVVWGWHCWCTELHNAER